MKYKVLSFALLALLLTAFIYLPQRVVGEEPRLFIPDKALCAKMLRFGKQAYMRGRYLNAKAYFRRAVQADPASVVAWRYYDLAAVFALAEKVEQDVSLIAPGVSTRGEPAPGTPSAAPPAPKIAPSEKGGVTMEEEEGC
jgi:hypothetical protein